MTAHTKPPAPPPLPDESATLAREEAILELHSRMRMIAGYAEIVQRNLDLWDTVGALQAYDKLRQHMVDCSQLRKKI